MEAMSDYYMLLDSDVVGATPLSSASVKTNLPCSDIVEGLQYTFFPSVVPEISVLLMTSQALNSFQK